MVDLPIYLDNHSTTRVDPRVMEAMLPFFSEDYGNAGSLHHVFGERAREAIQAAQISISKTLMCFPQEMIFTSGATESNNLVIKGIAQRNQHRGKHLISVETEHRAVLDPLKKLEQHGFEVTLLPVDSQGLIDLNLLANAIREDTILVSIMWANNEIGVLQPIQQIGELCQAKNVPFHSDATQAVGKIPIRLQNFPLDYMSFSGHKMYGPKGIGGLYVRRTSSKLESMIDGGGQQGNLRSGTLAVPLIVGLSKAMELCKKEMSKENKRLLLLRNMLFEGLTQKVPHLHLNGPALDDANLRLTGNLNVSFSEVDGEAMLMNLRNVALSSGSACTSEDPEPSHVLHALGLNSELSRASLRFGLGRFNTEEEILYTIERVAHVIQHLRNMN